MKIKELQEERLTEQLTSQAATITQQAETIEKLRERLAENRRSFISINAATSFDHIFDVSGAELSKPEI